MNCRVLNKDNTVSDIHVDWHGYHSMNLGISGRIDVQAGLWTTVDTIKSHYEHVNDLRRANGIEPRDIDSVVDSMVGAEAPFDIYIQTEDGCPWKHCGTLVRSVPYAGNAVLL